MVLRLSLGHPLRLINLSSLLLDARLLVINVDVDDVVFVEFPGPPLRNTVLDLLLELLLVRTLCKSLGNRLLMELIELVVESSDHLLDVLGLLFLIKLINDSLLNIHLSEANHLALRTYLNL